MRWKRLWSPLSTDHDRLLYYWDQLGISSLPTWISNLVRFISPINPLLGCCWQFSGPSLRLLFTFATSTSAMRESELYVDRNFICTALRWGRYSKSTEKTTLSNFASVLSIQFGWNVVDFHPYGILCWKYRRKLLIYHFSIFSTFVAWRKMKLWKRKYRKNATIGLSPPLFSCGAYNRERIVENECTVTKRVAYTVFLCSSRL